MSTMVYDPRKEICLSYELCLQSGSKYAALLLESAEEVVFGMSTMFVTSGGNGLAI